MSDRTTISVDQDVRDRLEGHKPDDKSWTAFLDDVADQLDGEFESNSLSQADIRETVVDATRDLPSRTADEVEGRLSRY